MYTYWIALTLLRAQIIYEIIYPEQFTSQTFINLCLRAVALLSLPHIPAIHLMGFKWPYIWSMWVNFFKYPPHFSEALILVNRGYAATLNKKLQRLLSRYVAVVASSECKSSQRSACYHSPTTAIRTNPSRRITVKRCDQCQTLLGRDTSAASIILDIFKYHQSYGTLDLPKYCIWMCW